MARIRSVKPEFWTDSTMVQLPHFVRLFYIALWTSADDHGYVRDEPDRLAMELMPRESVDEVEQALQLLYAAGRLEWLVDEDGSSYYRIATWEEHQKIDHPSKSRIVRESSRKVTISLEVRRDVAQKYGCAPGGESAVQCFYCESTGLICWWKRKDGKPSSWVTFSGLELDHVEAESVGGQSTTDNIVLACRNCNRSKGTKHWFDFLCSALNSQSYREASRTLAPERKGKEGKGNGKEWKGTISVRVPEDQTPDSLMQAVATELRITDQFVRISLSEQIRLALEAGEDGQKTCEAMIESGRAYRDSKKFEFGGWKKFFGSDAWRVKPTTKRKSVVEEAYDDLHAPLPQANQ